MCCTIFVTLLLLSSWLLPSAAAGSVNVLEARAAASKEKKQHELHFTWHVNYGTASPMGVEQRVIMVNGQFPGPNIKCTTNDNLAINVFNHLKEPLLFTWNGVQHRNNSWQDGMPGTNCPILPGTNYTYLFQVKDQIGSFFYYPSIGTQKAAGGFGGLQINSLPDVPVPYPSPADDYTVLIGDWYRKSHDVLAKTLDKGQGLGHPDGVLINGKARMFRMFPSRGKRQSPIFTMESGKTYKYRVCNVGLNTTISFQLQGHIMKLVEMDGTHTMQNNYTYLDVPVGRCFAVLVEANQQPGDYYMAGSARFKYARLLDSNDIMSVAVVRYAGSNRAPVPVLAAMPSNPWPSYIQLLSFHQNLTAHAASANQQGSYHYGWLDVDRSIRLANHKSSVNGKLRYGFNGVSHSDTDTPLMLAQYFKSTHGVFKYDVMPGTPPKDLIHMVISPNVITVKHGSFVEIIFENLENETQTFHLNGNSFFTVGMGYNTTWRSADRWLYNRVDAVKTHNVQVFPKSWAAVLVPFDNAGMWNLRSESLEKSYLGQQLYISVDSAKGEDKIPDKALLCGSVERKDKHPHTAPNPKAAPKTALHSGHNGLSITTLGLIAADIVLSVALLCLLTWLAHNLVECRRSSSN